MESWELHDGQQQVGPLDEEHVVRMIAAGLPSTTKARKAGTVGWRSVWMYAPFAAAFLKRGVRAWWQRRNMYDKISVGLAIGLFLALAGVSVMVLADREKGRPRETVVAQDAAATDAAVTDDAATDDAATDAVKLADEDREAVSDFAAQIEQIRATVKSTSAAIAKSDERGAPAVKSLRYMLDRYRGTSVEKGDAWRALDAQTVALEKRVQPYLDKLNAELREVRRHLEAEAEEDRRAGVKLTQRSYVASSSLEKVQRATKYVVAGDREGYTLLVQSDPEVTLLRDGLRVVPFERAGLLGSYVHVRIKGSLTEFWTVKEALREP